VRGKRVYIEERKYKPVLGKVKTDIGTTVDRWFILENGIPLFESNEWLERKNLPTSQKYARNLSKFLNFLEIKRKDFTDAKHSDIVLFIDYLVFGITDNLTYINQDGLITFSTLSGYITAITEFYRSLEDDYDETENSKWKKKKMYNADKHYLYGQIWGRDYNVIIEDRIRRLKASKEYTKWYTDKEEEALISNFNTLRDRAVFLCTRNGGVRIDEALSIRLQDYNRDEMTIIPYRSKGRESGTGRVVVLSEETCNVIDNYIWNERAKAEVESGKFTDILFINLRKGESQGEELSYNNYLPILKSCAKRAGLDPEKIRTHSGRSSKTMELLNFQSSHPEENLTDGMINQIMGWTSSKSIEPYKNTQDVRLAKLTAQKIQQKPTGGANYGSNS
jgi:integrase/recombinase XerD